MSGRQKWGDFKRRLTPEECLRVESKIADLRATLPPTTYAQVRWAAEEYNNGEHGYNGYYRNVYESDFRTSLLKRCSQSDADKLVAVSKPVEIPPPARISACAFNISARDYQLSGAID
jgi:hypothetical protein